MEMSEFQLVADDGLMF